MSFITSKAQTTFYNLNSIQKIEVQFSQSNWDFQMDTAKAGAEGYIMAQWVKINGVLFDSAGVKYKGNSSYNSTSNKNPVHIALDEFKEQNYQGFTDVKLGNGYADPSMIREVLSYNILQNYMHCPRANFAQLYINGAYIGLFSNAESISKKFCASHFYSSSNTFFKCNPTVIPGPTTKSNLRHLTSSVDSSGYFLYYELKSKYGWDNLVSLSNTVTNFSANISQALDVDRVIWMLAFNSVLVNLDSYSGVFAQNYYLYKDNTGHFNPIIWDLNMSFGGFPFVGSGNTSMGSQTILGLQQLSINAHLGDQYWPLINAVLNNTMYKKMYVAHMRTILSEMIVSNSYQTMATQLQSVADTAVQSDPNKFYTYTQFQNAMTTNYSVGSYSVPGINTLMAARQSYLLSTPDFTYTAPTISLVATSNASPAINSNFTITATVVNTNSSSVYLGYRFIGSDKFIRVPMFDDGNHGDGTLGDNVYGASITMGGGQIQYYIYAENNLAGMFSPQRAEHEYYSLISVPSALPGQVKINEILADNVSDVKNEFHLNEDWIEFYNTTNNALDLSGYYLSDDYSSPSKFSFPVKSIIPANGYLIVWADEITSGGTDIHCNFKLSQSGEQVILSTVSGVVLDSTRFGAQITDKSLGRCPDGVGTYTTLVYPTYKFSNCAVGISELNNVSESVLVYPNPGSDYIYVRNLSQTKSSIEVFDCVGKPIYKSSAEELLKIDTQNWAAGMYFLHLENITKKFIISH